MFQEEWTCAICLESHQTNLCTLNPCGHRFHTDCIYAALRTSGPSCPYCRQIPQNVSALEVDDNNEHIENIVDNNNTDNDYINNINDDFNFGIVNNMDDFSANIINIHNAGNNNVTNYVLNNIYVFEDNETRGFIINHLSYRNDLSTQDYHFIVNTINNTVNNYINNNYNMIEAN